MCEFAEEERENLLRDVLVIDVKDAKLREELLRDPDLDLQKAVQACKACERSQMEGSQIEDLAVSAPVAIAHLHNQSLPVSQKCPACGYNHGTVCPCPAASGTCNECGQRGHFSRVCHSYSATEARPALSSAAQPATSSAARNAASPATQQNVSSVAIHAASPEATYAASPLLAYAASSADYAEDNDVASNFLQIY